MKQLAFFILFLPALFYAQPHQGDLLIGLNMYAESQHYKVGDSTPGSISTTFSFSPTLGYFISENTMIGFTPRATQQYNQSLLQHGTQSKTKTLGARLFIRQYLPRTALLWGVRFFMEISGEGFRAEQKGNPPSDITVKNVIGNASLGFSKTIAQGLYFELTGEYRFFERSKFDNLLRYSRFWPDRPFRISSHLQILLENGKYFESFTPVSRKGWKYIGGNFTSTPVNGHFNVNFNLAKFESSNFVLGFVSNLGLRVDNESSWFGAGIGPLAKYFFRLTPHFGFLASLEGRASANFPIQQGNDRYRQNFLSATPAIGLQYFLNRNTAIELAWKRPFFWRQTTHTEEILHSANWRVFRFDWELVYYFE